MEWNFIKYLIAGSTLYAVEDNTGYIYKYCNTKSRAVEIAKRLSSPPTEIE